MPPPQTIETNSKGSTYAEDGLPRQPILSNLNHLEVGIAAHHRYVGPVMNKTSFRNSNNSNATTATTRSSSSNGSVDSPARSTRGVTFRDEKRVPKSINATTLSKSYSTLSRAEGSWNPGAGAISTNRNDRSHIMTSSSASNKSNSLMTKYGLSPNTVKFTFCNGKQHTIQETNLEEDNLATTSMFTDDDIDAITPLQITTYLTIKERERIGTKVLCSKLKKGYSLTDGKDVCDTCSMPKLSKSSKTVEKCAICPVLKKRVLKKILNGCC